MKENKITIEINKPASEVFAFTINPKNTSLWIDGVEIEETNEFPVKIGTLYRNRGNDTDEWNEYVVDAYEENKLFELVSKDGNYHVRYTYSDLDGNKSEMEYFEWVDKSEIEAPFDQSVLDKLKSVIEFKSLE